MPLDDPAQFYDWESEMAGGPVPTTNLGTRGNHTFAPRGGPFSTGAEAFNALSPMPSNFIDLGDGRVLCIRRWAPDGDSNLYGGAAHLPITIEGFITTAPLAECCECKQRKQCSVRTDPFLSEIHPDKANPPQWWCDECWKERNRET